MEIRQADNSPVWKQRRRSLRTWGAKMRSTVDVLVFSGFDGHRRADLWNLGRNLGRYSEDSTFPVVVILMCDNILSEIGTIWSENIH